MNSVLLINREMTIVHAPCLVQGISGEKVGVSKFSPKHSCHILELTPEAYEKNAKALMQACHIALRRWEPHFVFEEVPEKVREFWDGYNAGMDGKELQDEASYETRLGHESAAVKPQMSEATEAMFESEHIEYAGEVVYSMPKDTFPEAADTIDRPTPEPIASSLIGSLEDASKFMEGVSWSEETMPLDKVPEFFKKTFRIGPEITAKTRYWSLIKAAKDEGVDISKCKTNAERAKAINEKRCQPR